jgi:hypothetical protein
MNDCVGCRFGSRSPFAPIEDHGVSKVLVIVSLAANSMPPLGVYMSFRSCKSTAPFIIGYPVGEPAAWEKIRSTKSKIGSERPSS